MKFDSQLIMVQMLMAGARDPWGKSSATINHGMEPEAKKSKNK